MDQETIETLVALAKREGLAPAALMAVCEVESGGRYFAEVAGKREPLIRFEGHYFYRLLGVAKRNRAVVAGLAHQRVGKIRNPLTQAGRWKLLNRACDIDRQAALESTSWGIGQVMGIHWKWLEYASADALVAGARSGLEGQAELMLRFIEKSGLDKKMQQADWRGFARGYNGPAYASNRYDKKLDKAYRKYANLLGTADSGCRATRRHQPMLLRFGDRGEAVRQLQIALRRSGFPLKADGDFGPATQSALVRFQERHSLDPDGIAGPQTFAVLERVAGVIA